LAAHQVANHIVHSDNMVLLQYLIHVMFIYESLFQTCT
jgi:hypothetical protein